jgi:hypothetical protein
LDEFGEVLGSDWELLGEEWERGVEVDGEPECDLNGEREGLDRIEWGDVKFLIKKEKMLDREEREWEWEAFISFSRIDR